MIMTSGFSVVLVALGLLTMAPGAEAQTKAKPYQFGSGTLASWQVGAGRPAAGDTNQYGLYLQKGTATSSYAAAGVDITPLPDGLTADNLSKVTFQIPGVNGQPFGVANGYCGAGAPRINVYSTNGTCFLGCQAGNEIQDSTGWWTIKFIAPFTQYAGCEVGIGGTLAGIEMVMDEGTDQGPGNVVVDNIMIKRAGQATVIGAP
jgi:hypothetical protein